MSAPVSGEKEIKVAAEFAELQKAYNDLSNTDNTVKQKAVSTFAQFLKLAPEVQAKILNVPITAAKDPGIRQMIGSLITTALSIDIKTQSIEFAKTIESIKELTKPFLEAPATVKTETSTTVTASVDSPSTGFLARAGQTLKRVQTAFANASDLMWSSNFGANDDQSNVTQSSSTTTTSTQQKPVELVPLLNSAANNILKSDMLGLTELLDYINQLQMGYVRGDKFGQHTLVPEEAILLAAIMQHGLDLEGLRNLLPKEIISLVEQHLKQGDPIETLWTNVPLLEALRKTLARSALEMTLTQVVNQQRKEMAKHVNYNDLVMGLSAAHSNLKQFTLIVQEQVKSNVVDHETLSKIFSFFRDSWQSADIQRVNLALFAEKAIEAGKWSLAARALAILTTRPEVLQYETCPKVNKLHSTFQKALSKEKFDATLALLLSQSKLSDALLLVTAYYHGNGNDKEIQTALRKFAKFGTSATLTLAAFPMSPHSLVYWKTSLKSAFEVEEKEANALKESAGASTTMSTFGASTTTSSSTTVATTASQTASVTTSTNSASATTVSAATTASQTTSAAASTIGASSTTVASNSEAEVDGFMFL